MQTSPPLPFENQKAITEHEAAIWTSLHCVTLRRRNRLAALWRFIFHEEKQAAQTSQHIIHCVNPLADPRPGQSDGQHMLWQCDVPRHYVNDIKHPAAAFWQDQALSHHYTHITVLNEVNSFKRKKPCLLSYSLNDLIVWINQGSIIKSLSCLHGCSQLPPSGTFTVLEKGSPASLPLF